MSSAGSVALFIFSYSIKNCYFSQKEESWNTKFFLWVSRCLTVFFHQSKTIWNRRNCVGAKFITHVRKGGTYTTQFEIRVLFKFIFQIIFELLKATKVAACLSPQLQLGYDFSRFSKLNFRFSLNLHIRKCTFNFDVSNTDCTVEHQNLKSYHSNSSHLMKLSQLPLK